MKKLIASVAGVGFPVLGFAATAPIDNVDDIISLAFKYGNVAIQLFIAFAVIYIVYAIVVYVIQGDDETKKDAAKNKILWGVIGLVAILSIWGLVRIVRSTFNVGNNNAPVNEFPNVGSYNRVN